MNDIITLVKMQLKNQLELKNVGSKYLLLKKSVFILLRFVITLLLAYVLFMASSFLKIFHNSPYLPTSLMTMILAVILIIMIVATTNNLVNSLFLAADNKFLVTLPLATNKIFLSKIIIFYIFELARNATFTLPIFVAFGLFAPVSWFFFIWVFVAFIFISAIPVVIGMVLSVPTLLAKRLFARFPLIKVFFSLIGLSAIVYLLVQIILIIPPSINILHYWGPIKAILTQITTFFQTHFVAVYYLVVLIIGKYTTNLVYTHLHYEPWLVFLVLVIFLSILLFSTYFLVRFIFLKMISVDVERVNKKQNNKLAQPLKRPFMAFLIKEVKIQSRNGEFTYNFLLTYIGVPLFILLINQVFASMDLYETGYTFVRAFNIFLIVLTYFASNSVLATFFSKEGHAGYVKKTKPINVASALFAKLLPNIVLSLISLTATIIVLNTYMHFVPINIIFLTISLFTMQVGHIIFCALFDILNPLNEMYATSGNNPFNKNETQATIFAFVTAFIYAVYVLMFLSEELYPPQQVYNPAFLKLMLIGVVFLLAALYFFKWIVRAYYFDERTN